MGRINTVFLIGIFKIGLLSCADSPREEMEKLCTLAQDLEQRCVSSIRQRVFFSEAEKLIKSDSISAGLKGVQREKPERRYARLQSMAHMAGMQDWDCRALQKLLSGQTQAGGSEANSSNDQVQSAVEFLCNHAQKYSSEMGSETAQSFLCNTVYSASDSIDVHIKQEAAQLCVNLAWGSIQKRQHLIAEHVEKARLGKWSCPALERIFEIDMEPVKFIDDSNPPPAGDEVLKEMKEKEKENAEQPARPRAVPKQAAPPTQPGDPEPSGLMGNNPLPAKPE